MINKDSLTHHISQQFNAELEEVRSHLLAMGGLVEKQVNDAVTALIEADSGLAQQVREIDDQINQMETNIDEECLRILARRQPAASDLRLIISISKSVIDLERIGDEASKIAKRAIELSENGEAPRGYVEVRHIGDQVRKMVQEALDAFARFDADLALSKARFTHPVDGGGDHVPNAIPLTASLGVTADRNGPWYGGLRLRYLGAYALEESGTHKSSPFWTANLRLGHRLGRHAQISLDVLNLFDRKASDIEYWGGACTRNEALQGRCNGGIDGRLVHPLEPRSLRASLRIGF